MLVILIIGMAGMVAIPAYIHGTRAARLKTSVRAVTELNRYARRMAIIKQKHMAIEYAQEAKEVRVLEYNASRGKSRSRQLTLGLEIRSEDSMMHDEDETAEDRMHRLNNSHTVTHKRSLGKGIRFEFDSETDILENQSFIVEYWPTGYVQGHEVTVILPRKDDTDRIETSVAISVEEITGEISMEEENPF